MSGVLCIFGDLFSENKQFYVTFNVFIYILQPPNDLLSVGNIFSPNAYVFDQLLSQKNIQSNEFYIGRSRL